MADLKISQLSAATALAGTEVVPVVQSGSTKKATINQILKPAAGNGIDYSANTPAAGMTSQLLNLYEEGTYSPTITFSGGGSITLNASLKTLSYTRVGRLVTVTGYLLVSSVSSPTGYLILTLPFSSKANDAFSYSGSLLVSGAVSVPANGFGLLGLQNSGVAWVFLSNGTSLGNAVGQQMQANTEFRISFSYVAA